MSDIVKIVVTVAGEPKLNVVFPEPVITAVTVEKIGPKGNQGDTGLKGDVGNTGVKGDVGNTGLKGDAGADAPTFDQGLNTVDSVAFNQVTATTVSSNLISGQFRGHPFQVKPNQAAYFSPGLRDLASPPNGYLWHDLLAFDWAYIRSQELSTDGVNFISVTLQHNLFNQKQDQVVEVLSSADRAVRWTFQGVDWSLAAFLNIAQTWSSVVSERDFLIESSVDGVTWTTRHESTVSGYSKTITCGLEYWLGDSYLRITITKTEPNTDSIRLSSLRLLTDRAGDQGNGCEYHYPYTWDADKNIGVGYYQGVALPERLNVNGNINIINGGGIILESDNGTRFRMTVDNSGTPVFTAL